MSHQRLDGLEIVPFIQKDCGKRMPQHMGVNPLLDQGPFYNGFDEAVN